MVLTFWMRNSHQLTGASKLFYRIFNNVNNTKPKSDGWLLLVSKYVGANNQSFEYCTTNMLMAKHDNLNINHNQSFYFKPKIMVWGVRTR